MEQWYYAKNGQQVGPMSMDDLIRLVSEGQLTGSDLVWNASMTDWKPIGQVPGILDGVGVGNGVSKDNLYSAPKTVVEADVASGGALVECEPGSVVIEPTACISRGWEILKRNIGTVLVVGLVYFVVVVIMQAAASAVFSPMVANAARSAHESSASAIPANPLSQVNPVVFFGFYAVQMLVSTFLMLGFTRVGLNLVSGKSASVGDLFSQGGKLISGLVAMILVGLLVGVGCMLFVIPGIYFMLKYSQVFHAIVDRDMGPLEAMRYSAALTKNNKMPIVVFWLLAILLCIAGFIALCVGYFVALPVVWLGSLVAYRWMQYGPSAAMDHPGTQTPLLSDV